MQTFLPFRGILRSVRSLDRRRLGKQRVEAFQILQHLVGVKSAWKNHPAVKMWEGYAGTLALYGMLACQEWAKRGYEDNMMPRFFALYEEHGLHMQLGNPWWLGNEDFHASHQAALLRKDEVFYGPRFGHKVEERVETCCVGCNYWWPSHIERRGENGLA